jgi:hypothetical protein
VSPTKEETKEPVDPGTEPVKRFDLSDDNTNARVEDGSEEK